MPCLDHKHGPWPKSGVHRLLIEACETHCGWCDYKTAQANNLRVHARRHIANPKSDILRNIVIVAGKAGRSRVALRSKTANFPPVSTQSTLQPSPPGMLQLLLQNLGLLELKDILHTRIQELEGLLRQHGLQVPEHVEPDALYVSLPTSASYVQLIRRRSTFSRIAVAQGGTRSQPEIDTDVGPPSPATKRKIVPSMAERLTRVESWLPQLRQSFANYGYGGPLSSPNLALAGGSRSDNRHDDESFDNNTSSTTAQNPGFVSNFLQFGQFSLNDNTQTSSSPSAISSPPASPQQPPQFSGLDPFGPLPPWQIVRPLEL